MLTIGGRIGTPLIFIQEMYVRCAIIIYLII